MTKVESKWPPIDKQQLPEKKKTLLCPAHSKCPYSTTEDSMELAEQELMQSVL